MKQADKVTLKVQHLKVFLTNPYFVMSSILGNFLKFGAGTELKMTEWKTTVHISSSSQSSIATQKKIVLADGSLCSRQQIV